MSRTTAEILVEKIALTVLSDTVREVV